ncbi:MAG: imidazole glycerol phosphate synthase subunit HisH [Chloroflexi bacterium CG07_land_8_20_14_0_80_45_17]|nr:MAG: imidazole glycerol phosphate synthase subunit HisH [Chloroflexi bacterium CG23_combo_of_CG06-09_8_20_14_all_45_10]PIU56204.1 MAG: imidazole glycerol phosphate synthase subunit HisH [Chloroflexi bacterium CG07_land_8_20_14_0_80_45_17]
MNKEAVVVIDYGAGNLRSVVNAITKVGYQAKVTSNPRDVFDAIAIILPGVGAAGDTMDSLEKLGMSNVIRQLIYEGRPFFAVCVGLQVLFSRTEEGGWHECLGVIPGIVKRLPSGLKIPHMGWNQVKQTITHPLFDGVPDEANFYFVHSYYAEPEDMSVVAGTTDYGIPICSVVIKDNLVATQFHPEKSGDQGLKLYSNFLKMALSER